MKKISCALMSILLIVIVWYYLKVNKNYNRFLELKTNAQVNREKFRANMSSPIGSSTKGIAYDAC